MKKEYFKFIIGGLAVIVLAIVGLTYKTSSNIRSGDFSFYAGNATYAATTTGAGTFPPKVVLAENSARKYTVITNTGGTIAYLTLTTETDATIASSTLTGITNSKFVIPLAASGGTYVIGPDNLYKGKVVASSSAAVEIRSISVR